jgi:hypothetical protein
MADSSELPLRQLPGNTEEILETPQSRHFLRIYIRSQGTCKKSSSAIRSTSTNTAETNCSVRSWVGLVPGYGRIHSLTEWLEHFYWVTSLRLLILQTKRPSPQRPLSAHVSRNTNIINTLLDLIALQVYYLWVDGAIGELSDAAPVSFDKYSLCRTLHHIDC